MKKVKNQSCSYTFTLKKILKHHQAQNLKNQEFICLNRNNLWPVETDEVRDYN